jgi:hypothetical protein
LRHDRVAQRVMEVYARALHRPDRESR